jgi:YVTN family beta-propeller protein
MAIGASILTKIIQNTKNTYAKIAFMKKVLLRTIGCITLFAALLSVITINANPVINNAPVFIGLGDKVLNSKPVSDATFRKAISDNPRQVVRNNTGNTSPGLGMAPYFGHVVVPVFNATGALQTCVIPGNATNIKITATGGAGGSAGRNAGGQGAMLSGNYGTAFQGMSLTIVVGQKGSDGSLGAGGGGGSFVYVAGTPNTLVMAAGGGGGAGTYAASGDDSEHQINASNTLQRGNYGKETDDLPGGVGGGIGAVPVGTGGENASDGDAAKADEGASSGGGAGWRPSVDSDDNPELRGPYHGHSPQDAGGAVGGNAGEPAAGGYGGGGATSWGGGGGGGGYSGGGGGAGTNDGENGAHGGGGGSYFNTSDYPSATQGVPGYGSASSDGSVLIEYDVPEVNLTPATALNFDGVNNNITVNNTLGNFGSGDFTVEMSIRTTVSSGIQYLATKRGICSGDNFWSLQIVNGRLNMEMQQSISAPTRYVALIGTTTITDGQWHHVALTRQLGNVNIYVDGALETSSNATIANLNNNYTLEFGSSICNGQNGSVKFVGDMDEIRIWGRALCTAELDHYRHCELTLPQIRLQAYYKLNAGNINANNAGITTAVDETGANNGTLNNFGLTGTTSNWVAGTVSGTCTPYSTTPVPNVGNTTVCVGKTTQLTNAHTGGTWSTSNSGTATVNASGLITGVADGNVTITYIDLCGGISTSSVTVNALPIVAASTLNPICVGEIIELFSNPPGATSYAWVGPNSFTSNQQNPTISPAALINGGTYTVTVTDANGCSASATATSIVNALPVITASSNSPVCQGGVLSLSASGGVSYVWSGPVGSGIVNQPGQTLTINNATLTATGTYFVKGTGANGCRNDASVNVTVNPLPAVPTNGSSTARCGPGSGTFSATAGSGETIDWYNAPTGGSLVASAAPNYTVSVSSTTTYYAQARNTTTGCVSASRIASTVTISLPPPMPSITASGSLTLCSGGSVVLTSSTAATYLWSPGGATTKSITVTTAGNYSVLVTNGACSISSALAVVTVNSLATPTFTQVAAICSGASLAALPATSINGIAGTWSPALNNTATTTYTFFPNAGQCATTATMTITVNPLPAAPTGSNGSTCGSGAFFLTATPGAGETIDWYSAASGGTLLVSNNVNYFVPGTATVTVYAQARNIATGCVSATRTTFTGTVIPLPAAPIGLDASRCGPGNVTLTATAAPGESVDWYTAASGGAPIHFTSNTHTVTSTTTLYAGARTATNNCVSATRTAVTGTVNPLPSGFSVGGGGNYCAGGTGLTIYTGGSTVGVNYDLKLGGSVVATLAGTGSDLYFNNITAAGNYTVVATNQTTNCTAVMPGSATVTVIANVTPTFTQVAAICSGASLSALATTSNNNITGTWSPALNSTATTTYTFTPNAGQCATTTTMTITVNAPPVILDFTGSSNICEGSSSTIKAFPNASEVNFKWYDAATGGNLLSSAGDTYITGPLSTTTTYYIEITNYLTGCTASPRSSITINVRPKPTISAITGTTVVCSGSGTTLTASTSASAPTVKWYNASNTLLFTGASYSTGNLSSSATYYAEVTSNGCVSDKTPVIVNVNAPVTPTFNQVAAICAGTSLSALPTTSDNGITGTWSPALDNTATTTYTFTPNAGQCATTATMTITVNDPTSVTITNNSPTICEGNTTLLFVNVSAMSGVWSSSNPSVANTESPFVSNFVVAHGVSQGSAVITYTYTNANGCVSSATTNITVTPRIAPTFNQVAAICAGTSLSALPTTSNNGIAGTWSPALNNAATTTYTFTPNVGQCGTTATMTITVNSLPTATISGSTDVCQTAIPPVITFTGANGTAPYTFTYSLNGGPSQTAVSSGNTATVNAPTGVVGTLTYQLLSVSDAGSSACSNTATGSAVVEVRALPTISGINGNIAVCSGSSVTLTASSAAPSPTFRWYSAATGGTLLFTGAAFTTPTLTSNTTYYVEVSSPPVPCTDVSRTPVNVIVNSLPNVTASTLNPICVGEVIELFTSPGSSFLWTGPNSFTSNQQNPTIPNAQLVNAGTYTVVVTDANGCSASASATSIVNALPVITAGSNSPVCEGSTLNLTSTGGVSYVWNGPNSFTSTDQNPVLNNVTLAASGTYFVKGTGANGCRNDASVNVTINPSPVATINPGGPIALCAGGSVVLTSGSATGNLWSTGAVTQAITVNAAGSYSVTVSNNGCSSVSAPVVVTVNPLPAAPVGTDVSSCGANIVLTATPGPGETIDWYNTPTGGTAFITGQNSIPTNLSTTFYAQARNIATGCVSATRTPVTSLYNTLPTPFLVSGGGAYCVGGTGVSINLSGSQIGVNYTLVLAPSTIVATLAGTGSALVFSNITAAGGYVVNGTNATTNCTTIMTANANVNLIAPPTINSITGLLSVCANTGTALTASSTAPSPTFRWYDAPSGGNLLFTGSTYNTPLLTSNTTYYVDVTSGGGCSSVSTVPVTVTVNPLPTTFNVTGGGSYCSPGPGLSITLVNSQSGVNYTLVRNGNINVVTQSGSTGNAVVFANQTVAGTYTISAKNATTNCSSTMNGSVTITSAATPSLFNVTGGGSYCAGGTGVTVGLGGSQNGMSYQLNLNGSPAGSPVNGNGSTISFGNQTGAGTYTVTATNTGLCAITMNGNVVVTINPLPTVNAVSSQTICANTVTAPVNFSGSVGGTTYNWANTAPSIGLAASGTGNIPSFTALNGSGAALTANITVTPVTNGGGSGGSFAYVPNYCSNTVSVINTATNVVATTISGFQSPFAAGISPDGSKVYIANRSGGVSVISTATNTITANITAGTTPTGIAISPDGTKVYVANESSSNVSVINTSNNTVLTTVGVGSSPRGITISPDGSRVYAVNLNSASVSAINTATNTVVATIAVGSTPLDAAVSPDGSRLYVTNYSSGNVSVINTSTNSVLTSITVGSSPWGIKVIPGGSKVYVANNSSNNVSIINTATNTVSATLTVGNSPAGISFTPDGSKVYITNQGSGTASVFNTSTNALITTISVGNCPYSMGTFIQQGSAGCTGPSTSFTITVNPLPTAYSVTGSGAYCAGSGGRAVGLSNSQTGVSYQLILNGATNVGSPVGGTGSAISFGNMPLGTYTVIATSSSTNCVQTMSGSAIVTQTAIPATLTYTSTFNCNGSVNLSVNNATGPVTWSPGGQSGNSIVVTVAGSYSATQTVNGCTSANAPITATPVTAPAVFAVGGGGASCSGGTGVSITLSGSETGVTYTLVRNGSINAASLAGTVSAISFNNVGVAGTYTINAHNNSLPPACLVAMTGSVPVSINTAPVIITCFGDQILNAGANCTAMLNLTSGLTISLGVPAASVSYTLSGATTGSGSGSGNGLTYNKGVTTVTVSVSNPCGTVQCSFNVTVVDNEFPVIVNTPSNITQSNDAGVCKAAVSWTAATATDNCPGVTLVSSHQPGDVFPVGTTTVTYTATDAAGHVTTTSFMVTVVDTEVPIVHCPSDIVVTANTTDGNGVPGYIATYAAISSDNCGVQSTTYSIGSGSFFPLGTTPVTVTVVDIHGLTSSCIFNVIVNCVTPVFTQCPADISTNTDAGLCSAVVTYTSVATGIPAANITYTLSGATTGSGSGDGSGSTFNKGVTTVTITATNMCGTATCSFNVTVVDNEFPVIVNTPSNITQPNDAVVCKAAVSWTAATATDNCPGVTLISSHQPGDVFPVGTTTVTYTATDAAGHVTTTSFTVTVVDTEVPIVHCPSDIIVTANTTDGNGVAGYIVTYSATSADNCGVQSTTYSIIPGSFFPIGTTPVTVTVVDIHGLTSSCTFNVIVNCVTPVFTQCPTDISTNTDAGLCSAVVTYSSVATGIPAANISYTLSGATTGSGSGDGSGLVFNKGVTTVTITATNICGTAQCSFNVTVFDSELPVIVNTPANVTQTNDAGICGAVISWTEPIASDNCPGVTLVSSHQPGDIFPVGTITVTYTATDAYGQSVQTSFTITVTDDENPVIFNTPLNISQSNDPGVCGAKVSWKEPFAKDNCDGVTLSSDHHPGELFPVGTTTVTYTATDAYGHTVQTSFTVTVIDNEAPVIVCAPLTLQLGAGGTVSLDLNNILTISGSKPPADNTAEIKKLMIEMAHIQAQLDAYNQELATLSSPDDDTRIQELIKLINDGKTAMVFMQKLLNELQNPKKKADQAPVPKDKDPKPTGNNLGTVSDNCKVGQITVSQSTFDCSNLGANLVTITVTDIYGNSSQCQTIVTIEDPIAPTITAPADVAVNNTTGICGATNVELGNPVTADNCSVTVTNDAPATFPVGTTIVTWTVTDAAGNTATATQTVTVTDDENPVIVHTPLNITQTNDAGVCGAKVSWHEPVASDNCPGVTLSSDHHSGETFPVGTTTVTYTATDAYGHSVTSSFTVTVTDDENPVIVHTPLNITQTNDAGVCGARVSWHEPVASDNCPGVTLSSDHHSGETFPVGTTTVTYTATDAYGHSVTSSFTVTVTDDENPVITHMPLNIIQTNDAGVCGARVSWHEPVASDNCPGVTLSSDHHSGETFPVGTTTVTYTATDAYGHSVTSSFTVTVTDDENPVIVHTPLNITQTNDAGVCGAKVSWTEPYAKDNCPGVTLSSDHHPGELFPIGSTTVTYIATDSYGHHVSTNFTVTVTDNELPVITCPGDITHTADAGKCSFKFAASNNNPVLLLSYLSM